jgi:hypothetical protein
MVDKRDTNTLIPISQRVSEFHVNVSIVQSDNDADVAMFYWSIFSVGGMSKLYAIAYDKLCRTGTSSMKSSACT